VTSTLNLSQPSPAPAAAVSLSLNLLNVAPTQSSFRGAAAVASHVGGSDEKGDEKSDEKDEKEPDISAVVQPSVSHTAPATVVLSSATSQPQSKQAVDIPTVRALYRAALLHCDLLSQCCAVFYSPLPCWL